MSKRDYKIKTENNKILVIGDVMLDRYWFATPVALAAEAPVPVVSISSNEYRAGGAANVALNIKMLGGDVAILAPLGTDSFGAVLSNILEASGVRNYWLYDDEINTITKHRVLTHKQQFLRVDFERHYRPIILNKQVLDLIAEYDVIVCSDYNKGSLANVAAIIEYARSLDKIVLVDPKGNDFLKYKHATIITPNYKEFTQVVGDILLDDKQDVDAFDTKAYDLLNTVKLEYLLVTCGSDGMVLFGKNNYKYSASSYAQQVYDVTGAGDTVLASLAVSLSNKDAYSMAIERASHAAACVVGQVGTGFVTKDQIDQQMASYYNQHDKNNIINNKIIKISQPADLPDFLDDEYYLYKIDSAKDPIITKQTVTEIMALNSDKVCVILINKLQNAKHSLYNLDEIAYIFSKIKVVNKVVYAIDSSINLEQIKKNSTKKEVV